ncbi:MAG: succinylglutamate desuccinylase/aspartoacylase family protein [Chlamydiia bacterium]|nr:succinylglutamate desuccinylase/aspartoacylase family protein [Chlamydiia bacterium]
MKNDTLKICGIDVQPGEKLTFALPTPEIYSCAPMHIPMHIIHGKKAGPRVLICATLYGDEANGIDIVHRLLNLSLLKKLQGTLICIPVMNVYGLINHTRLLPDGHDLANSFPGSQKGSFASRLAHLFTSEVISLMTHCINLRCGTENVYKLPQVYYHPEDQEATQLAELFGAPIIRPSNEKTGFFYSEAGTPKCPTLIYEGGEAHRTDSYSAKIGVKGIVKVLKELDMIRLKSEPKKTETLVTPKSLWVHSPTSGLFHFRKRIGQKVEKDQIMATIADPFGTAMNVDILAPQSGIISATTTHPHVYEGQGVIEICLSDKHPSSNIELEPSVVEPNIVEN